MPDLELTAPDRHRFAAYRADFAGGGPPRGAVVVVQEIFGVNAHIREVTDRLAEAGFVGVAPALFDRLERGVELDYDEAGLTKGRALAWDTPLDGPITDLTATCDALAGELGGPHRVGMVGFCYGGMLTAAVASRSVDHLAAAVAYYPSMAAQLLVDDVPGVPLLVHLGDRDQRVTVADGQALESRWPAATFHHYEDAGHGFNCDRRADFSPDASARAWRRTLAFLDSQLNG